MTIVVQSIKIRKDKEMKYWREYVVEAVSTDENNPCREFHHTDGYSAQDAVDNVRDFLPEDYTVTSVYEKTNRKWQ